MTSSHLQLWQCENPLHGHPDIWKVLLVLAEQFCKPLVSSATDIIYSWLQNEPCCGVQCKSAIFKLIKQSLTEEFLALSKMSAPKSRKQTSIDAFLF